MELSVYTSMYGVLTLLFTNGEHVTDQMKVIYLYTVYQKGYFTDAIDSFTNRILGYIVQTRQVVKIK